MTLYINACMRTGSRTDRIARVLLQKLGGPYEEVKLSGAFAPLTEATLSRRTALIEAGDYTDPMFDAAKQFAAADVIVIAAPFWDYSFPADLKVYFENIYVTGLVSRYGPNGMPVGLCRARKLYYVTTAGGPYVPTFSYDWVKALAQIAFGIPETELIAAELLDVDGFDAEQIVADTIAKL